MVCSDGDFFCVPRSSITKLTTCLPSSKKCDGVNDCVLDEDEKDCEGLALLSPGIQALIAISVIVFVILIPVIYVIVQKKRGKPLLPSFLRPFFNGIRTRQRQQAANVSSQHLAGSHGSIVTNNSTDKDNFTRVHYESREAGEVRYPNNAIQNRNNDQPPAYQDLQTVQLEPYSSAVANDHSSMQNNHHYERINRSQDYYKQSSKEDVTMDNYGYSNTGGIHYYDGPNRAATRNTTPFVISSANGQASFETRSHLKQYQRPGPASASVGPSSVTRPSHPSNQHNSNSLYDSVDTSRGQPLSHHEGIPPHQLRTALERLQPSSYDHGNRQYHQQSHDDTDV